MSTPGQALDIARTRLGDTAGGSYVGWLAAWNGMPAHDRWGPAFASWVLACAGLPADAAGRYANADPWAQWFRARGRLAHTPVPGAIVFYDWDSDEHPEHCGLVEGHRPDGRIVTIEGDVDRGDGEPPAVWRMLRNARRGVYGYGLPRYDQRRRAAWP